MKKLLFTGILCFTFSSFHCDIKDISEEIKQDIKKYVNELPGIGMILDEVNYEGMTLSKFYFENDKKFIVCPANATVEATVNYKVDPEKLSTLHLHHYFYGLFPNEPQGDLLKSFGMFHSSGTAKLHMVAPNERGVYQVRFCHGEGLTYEMAKEAWWSEGHPDEKTTMGILVVE